MSFLTRVMMIRSCKLQNLCKVSTYCPLLSILGLQFKIGNPIYEVSQRIISELFFSITLDFADKFNVYELWRN